jgi:hypothetical protein
MRRMELGLIKKKFMKFSTFKFSFKMGVSSAIISANKKVIIGKFSA